MADWLIDYSLKLIEVSEIIDSLFKRLILHHYDELRITANQSYTLFTARPNFDKFFTPHKKFLWHFIKKRLSREISDETRNAKKLFHEQGKDDESCPIQYSHFTLFSHFHGSSRIVHSQYKKEVHNIRYCFVLFWRSFTKHREYKFQNWGKIWDEVKQNFKWKSEKNLKIL